MYYCVQWIVADSVCIVHCYRYHAFKRELVDYFPEMCPILYQYIRYGLSAVGGHPEAAEMHRMVYV